MKHNDKWQAVKQYYKKDGLFSPCTPLKTGNALVTSLHAQHLVNILCMMPRI